MITMQETEMKIYLRQVLRSWENSHNRIVDPQDVKKCIEFADNYYKKSIKACNDNKNSWESNSA